ncbi:MAG: hypothetical protein QW815_03070 [Nitrososphaerota archaeon]
MPPFRDSPFQSRVYGLSPEEERELVDMYLEARGLRRNPNAPGGYEITGPPNMEKAQEVLNRIRQRLLEKRLQELEGLQPVEEPPKPGDISDAIREYFLPEGSGPATPTQTPTQGFQVQLPQPGKSIFMTEQREGKPLIPPTPRPVPKSSRAVVVTPPPNLRVIRRQRMIRRGR